MKSYRQGDVLIVESKKKVSEGSEVKNGDDIVFMWGEVTGHAHRIKDAHSKARLLDVQAERYLQVLSEATITHEEHGAIVLKKGRYKQAFQVEERGEEVRRVED